MQELLYERICLFTESKCVRCTVATRQPCMKKDEDKRVLPSHPLLLPTLYRLSRVGAPTIGNSDGVAVKKIKGDEWQIELWLLRDLGLFAAARRRKAGSCASFSILQPHPALRSGCDPPTPPLPLLLPQLETKPPLGLLVHIIYTCT
jgi:hypothetical protein